ncbi:MAG: hypothetical protein WDM88_07325 [Galbitalea sp.]
MSARSRRASPASCSTCFGSRAARSPPARTARAPVDGERVEGGYYLLDAADRARQVPPALDDKVLTGWNGLAVSALARAGSRLGHPEWIDAAVTAPTWSRPASWCGRGSGPRPPPRGRRSRTSGCSRRARGPRARDGRAAVRDSRARTRAVDAGAARLAVNARSERIPRRLRRPRGADPVLAAHGLVLESDRRGRVSERPERDGRGGAAPRCSGRAVRPEPRSARGGASLRAVAPLALRRPVSFGATLGVLSRLAVPVRQLVVVTEDRDSELARVARDWAGGLVAIVTRASHPSSPPRASSCSRRAVSARAGRRLPLRGLRVQTAGSRRHRTARAVRLMTD